MSTIAGWIWVERGDSEVEVLIEGDISVPGHLECFEATHRGEAFELTEKEQAAAEVELMELWQKRAEQHRERENDGPDDCDVARPGAER